MIKTLPALQFFTLKNPDKIINLVWPKCETVLKIINLVIFKRSYYASI